MVDAGVQRRVAIIGSRDYPDAKRVVFQYVWDMWEQGDGSPPIIISGGARGVDRIAEEAALRRGLDCVVFPANWEEYGKSAGYLRNAEIVDSADRVVAFWDGESKGTKHTINLALAKKKNLEVIFPHD